MAICGYIAALKSLINHYLRGSPVTVKLASRAQQTCVYLRASRNLPGLLLTPPLIHAAGKTEGRERMSEKAWLRVTVVKEPGLASKSLYRGGVVG